ncbi:MAG: VOC family protein [Burkholderiaceae bacterium]|nr:VOC family protein [Burkholderiaceae bacterium]
MIHFEIHASQPQLLIDFYTSLFAWKFQQWGDREYSQIETGPADQAGINGGLVRRRGSTPVESQAVNVFVCAVQVTSVDEFFSKVLSLGASVAIPKMPIAGVGWLAYIRDSDSNLIALMQPDAAAK